MVIVGLVFLIIPILFFGLQIFRQIEVLFSMIQNAQGNDIQNFGHAIESIVRHVLPNFSFNISVYTGAIINYLSNNISGLVAETASIFFQTFFLLFTLFFFLRDGETIASSLVSLSPFQKEESKEILESVHHAVTSVIRVTFVVGLIRMVIMTVGFYLFGIPNALLWGSLAGIIGAIPGLGTPFAIVPMALYFLFTGNVLGAVEVASFGVLIMFFIDNLLSTYFFGRGLDAPPIFIIFSIIGGILFFGPLGFIFGPIILSLCISAIDMYKILILRTKILPDS
jgi:predicted PurR-regulated permease PerM